MCTRELPYQDVMLEKSDIIDLVAGNSNPETLAVIQDHLLKTDVKFRNDPLTDMIHSPGTSLFRFYEQNVKVCSST